MTKKQVEEIVKRYPYIACAVKKNQGVAEFVYELYDGTKLLQQERMDFQTHFYELGEIEPYLKEIGFTKVNVYSSYDKKIAENNLTEIFLYECSF